MSPSGRHKVIGVLLSLLLVLVLLEVALAWADPLGVRYVYQFTFIADYYTGPSAQYRLAPGTYQMGAWSATVRNDFTRAVPDSATGCRLTFFGDSLTWGWGVSDRDTFINQLARRWPDWELVNAGQVGYNATQVQAAIESSTFDQGVYLLVNNDAARPLNTGGHYPAPGTRRFPGMGLIHGQTSALRTYYVFMATRFGLADISIEHPDWPAYWAALDAIAARGDVQIVAFDEPYGREAAARYPVHLIPGYNTTVSMADRHPDKAGHGQIADALSAIIQQPC